MLVELDIPKQLIIEQMDPFYAECRAYGRIEEKKLNGKVAVRCYGFTDVPADREEEISQTFNINIDDWQRPAEEYKRPSFQRQPFRAIVKDLVRTEVCFTKAMVRKMRTDLRKLREIHIVVRDIRSDNYLDGKLVDFSVSWTVPHLMLSRDIRSERAIDISLVSDTYDFDDMIKDEGISTNIRAVTPPPERRSNRIKLKSQAK